MLIPSTPVTATTTTTKLKGDEHKKIRRKETEVHIMKSKQEKAVLGLGHLAFSLSGIGEECGGTRHEPLVGNSAIPPVPAGLLRPGDFRHVDPKRKNKTEITPLSKNHTNRVKKRRKKT